MSFLKMRRDDIFPNEHTCGDHVGGSCNANCHKCICYLASCDFGISTVIISKQQSIISSPQNFSTVEGHYEPATSAAAKTQPPPSKLGCDGYTKDVMKQVHDDARERRKRETRQACRGETQVTVPCQTNHGRCANGCSAIDDQ